MLVFAALALGLRVEYLRDGAKIIDHKRDEIKVRKKRPRHLLMLESHLR